MKNTVANVSMVGLFEGRDCRRIESLFTHGFSTWLGPELRLRASVGISNFHPERSSHLNIVDDIVQL